MKLRNFLVAIAFIAVSAVSVFAEDVADPRVKKALDSLGIKYTVNDSKNYKVVYKMESDPDRSQLVFVVSKTSTYKNLEVREIWTIAAVLDAYPDEETIQRLYTMNSTTKIGAWAMEINDDGEVWVIYTAKVLAAMSPKELTDIIYFVAEVGDEMEVDLVGDDEY